MENQIIPAGTYIPYSLADLSVVIPQAEQYRKRIQWFIPQYIKSTPPEVVEHTLVTFDPEDYLTKKILAEYKIKGLEVSPPHSTYKMEAGFNQVKTRLCVRMHNDTFIARTDWADRIIDQFNKERRPQLIGAFHISGSLPKEIIDAFLKSYPMFAPVAGTLIFNSNDKVGAPYLAGYFMASQTFIFRGLSPIVNSFNEYRMDKEDLLLTLFASVFNIAITNWLNMGQFLTNPTKGYGDLEEDEQLPTEGIIITKENQPNYPPAEFKEVIDGQR